MIGVTDKLRGIALRFGCLAAVSASAYLASCDRSEPPAAGSPVVARVGSVEIRLDDLKKEAERRTAKGQPVPAKEALLEEMVERETLIQRAKKGGLEQDPRIRREYENLLIGALKEGELWSLQEKVEVSEQELRDHYQKEIRKHTRPPKARLAIMHLKVHHKMSEAAREAVEARLEEARQKALTQAPDIHGFGKLSVDYSEDQATRYKGGDVGWLDEGADYRWPGAVIAAGFALAKGEVSEVQQSDHGYYLVKNLDSRESVVVPFEQVKEGLRIRIRKEKFADLKAAFHRQMQEAVAVERFPEALDAFDLPSQTMAKTARPEPPAIP